MIFATIDNERFIMLVWPGIGRSSSRMRRVQFESGEMVILKPDIYWKAKPPEPDSHVVYDVYRGGTRNEGLRSALMRGYLTKLMLFDRYELPTHQTHPWVREH